jgi:hypothetical protein
MAITVVTTSSSTNGDVVAYIQTGFGSMLFDESVIEEMDVPQAIRAYSTSGADLMKKTARGVACYRDSGLDLGGLTGWVIAQVHAMNLNRRERAAAADFLCVELTELASARLYRGPKDRLDRAIATWVAILGSRGCIKASELVFAREGARASHVVAQAVRHAALQAARGNPPWAS